MTTPVWQAAAIAGAPQSAHINQGLGTHASTMVYQGTSFSSQTTAGSGTVQSNGLWIAQSFTTGASTTAVGRIAPVFAVTGVPSPLTVQIQTNNAGAPSGTAVVTTIIPPGWGNASAVAQSIPLPVTGLSAATTYWLVTQPAGDVSDYYEFSKSNQTSGVSTSPDGVTWTAQTYGIEYTAYDQTVIPPLVHTWEDSDARITEFFYNANGSTADLEEYTVGQTVGTFLYSYRTFHYSAGGIITSLA